jgi:hypothetical protein
MKTARVVELDGEDHVISSPTLKQLRENTDVLIIRSEEPFYFQLTFEDIEGEDYVKNFHAYVDIFKTQRAKFLEARKIHLHGGVPGARGIR